LNTWKRSDAAVLAEAAMKAGLEPDNALDALTVGARILAHGFTDHEVDGMIQRQYLQRLEDSEAVRAGRASLAQTMRVIERFSKTPNHENRSL
jgi:hypothetical protein